MFFQLIFRCSFQSFQVNNFFEDGFEHWEEEMMSDEARLGEYVVVQNWDVSLNKILRMPRVVCGVALAL